MPTLLPDKSWQSTVAGGLCSRLATAVLLGLILGAGAAPVAWADNIQRWTDDKGRVHFSDQPQGKKKNGNREDPVTAPYDWIDDKGRKAYSDRSPEKVQAERRRILHNMECMEGVTKIVSGPAGSGGGRVVLLTARWCAASKSARTWLKKNGIRFVEYDIDRQRAGRVLYEKLRRRGVPVIIAGNQRMFGFRADLASKVLRRSGHRPPAGK